MAATTSQRFVALAVEYDGGAFRGFQRQAAGITVQGALEEAASRVAAEPVRVVAAGRTDAGVHATGQVVSFATRAERSPDAWRRGVSSLLPAAAGVCAAREFATDFNARFDASWRRYVYVFADVPVRPVIHRGLVAWARPRGSNKLNIASMRGAAQALVGERDFSAFRAAGCQSRSPWRRVYRVDVYRRGEYVAIDVTANAFLLRMVRNIAGLLLAVGRGELPPTAAATLLVGRDRALAPPTAPPEGLYLVGVGYPQWRLPARSPPVFQDIPDGNYAERDDERTPTALERNRRATGCYRGCRQA